MEENHNTPERFSLKSVFQAIIDQFNVDKGFIKTYRLLTTQPGKSIRTFLMGDRKLLTKPFQLLIVSTAIAAFFTIQIMPKDNFIKGVKKGSMDKKEILDNPTEEQVAKMEKLEKLNDQIMEVYGRFFNLFILLMIPFVSLATYWFFKKTGFNYAEHIIFNSYVLSYQNLVFILSIPLIFFVSAHFIWVYILIAYVYYFYACRRFFEMNFLPNFARAFGALVVGTLMYIFVLMIAMIGVIAFLVKNQFPG